MTEARQASEAAVVPARAGVSLGFSLNFLSGHGLLTAKDRVIGPFELEILELEIPEISFPFDVTGGSERFKSRRCALNHLVFGLSSEGLNNAIHRSPLVDSGFVEIKSAVRDGFVEFTGRFAVGDHQADFTFRAALLVRSRSELNVAFYDTRVYGWLPVPSSLLPVYLRRALEVPFETDERAGIWRLKPVEQFLRGVLPRGGWKVPDTRSAGLVAAECARGRLIMVAGPETEPNVRQVQEREPDKAAVIAGEGIANNVAAEQALGRGDIQEAYFRYREAIDDERGGPWARMRLLQIGAADPELTLETRNLAEEVLTADDTDVQALLAIAAIAMREGSFGDAAGRYGILAEIARNKRQRFDAIAAELAAAQASTPIDPGGALAAYERAAARARDSVVAHQALLELRGAQGDWEGAVQAGERLAKLEPDPKRKAAIHRRLGGICRSQVGDLKRARLHFERSLRITPDDPGALEGLAETYAARGEPARAASYIARLAEQAEEQGERGRIAALNLRLGEIWERWLGDSESAAARYQRVLAADPKNFTAQLRLAALAEARGDLSEARGYYEDILAVEEETGGEPEAIPDLVAAYTRLARVTLSAEGMSTEAVACLERAVELDPHNRTARDDLARLLRDRGEWGRLVLFLEEWTEAASDPEEIRRSHLYAAKVQIEQRRDMEAGREHLEQVLNVSPQDREALELIIPIIEDERDTVALTQRLAAAADATAEPVRRADFLYQLATARAALGLAVSVRIKPLEAAIAANPYHAAAARALVALLREENDDDHLAAGLECVAIAASSRDARVAALLERANLLYDKLASPQRAEAAMREALALAPGHVQGWIDLANMQREQGNQDGARETLESVVSDERVPASARLQIHQRLAHLARELERPEDEAIHLRAIIEAGHGDGESSARLIEVLRGLDRQGELADLLEGWAQRGEGDAAGRLWLQAAGIHHDLGHLDRAQEIYERLARQDGSIAASAALSLERLALERDDFDTVAAALEMQLARTPQAQQPPLFERLIDAHVLRDDGDAARTTCNRLLAIDGANPKARRSLAQEAESRGEYGEVLSHLAPMLLDGAPADELPEERRTTFVRAAALAHEIDPPLVDALQARFDEEFPDAVDDALAHPFAAMLSAAEKWDELLELRLYQLREDPRAEHRRAAAQVLYHNLDRIDEAVELYEQVLDEVPDDLAVQLALVEIYDRSERFVDLGKLLFTMSQQAADPEDALAFGLRSAKVFGERAEDVASAQQSLRSLSERQDLDPNEIRLLDALRVAEMFPELANVSERSLNERPDVEDGRFAHLIALYTGPLAQPAAAANWCQRLSESFGESDTPWRTWVNILGEAPEVGDASAVLQAWADAREGEARAVILLELAEVARDAGNEESMLAALGGAAAADPTSIIVLTQLVDVHTERQDWPAVIEWIGKLADLHDTGEQRDEYLRQLIAIALEDRREPDAAARALAQLSSPTASETATLGNLYIDYGDFLQLAHLQRAIDLFDDEALVRGGRGLAENGLFSEAKAYFERAFRDHDAQRSTWAVAAECWRGGGQLADLGKWRIEYSAHEEAFNPTWLRLTGYLELVEAGEDNNPILHGLDLAAEFQATDLQKAEDASLVFDAAKAAGMVAWVQRSASALEKLLPDDAPKAIEVLRLRFEQVFAAAEYDNAIELAGRLLSAGDPGADGLLERALEAAGRVDELLTHLTNRAEAGGDSAGPTWLRLAELHSQRQSWSDAASALGRLLDDARTLPWAILRYDVGTALEDPAMKYEGAALRAQLGEDDAERAEWQRVAGRLLWWELDHEDEGRALLQRAQQWDPTDVEAVFARAQRRFVADDNIGAQRALEEGLAVLNGPQSIILWAELVDVCVTMQDYDRAIEALEAAIELGTDDAEMWSRFAERANEISRGDLALRARAAAYALDPVHEAAYVTALTEAQQWERLVEVLEARAGELEAEEAAVRYERAATLARDMLGDRERAVGLLGEAVRATPTEQNLRETFSLAVELDRSETIAVLGPTLLEYLAEGAADRPEVLRRTVDALTHVAQIEQTHTMRQELVQLGIATAADKLVLGRLERDGDPAAAAALLQEGAIEGPPDERAAYFFEAALAWHEADDDGSARPLLMKAIEGGIDTAEIHTLALALLDGPARMQSAFRLISLDGDAQWEDSQRAALRLDLAQFRLQGEAPDDAYELLMQARGFAKAPGWVIAMEATLQHLSRREELAELWLAEGEEAEPAWQGNDLLARINGATAIYAELGNKVGELRALERLARCVPDNVEVRDRLAAAAAEVGDTDMFLKQVNHQLTRASDADARTAIVLRYAPILEQQFEKPEAATGMIRAVFVETPTVELADALLERLVADHSDELVELLVIGAGSADSQTAVGLLMRAANLTATPGGDAARAYAIYRDVLALDPAVPQARAYCLEYGEGNELWPDTIELLQLSATADAAGAHGYLVRAADIARDKLEDRDRQLELVALASDAAPADRETSSRLFDLQIEHGDLDAAQRTYLAGRVAPAQQVVSGRQLAELLRGAERPDDAEGVLDWMAEHNRHSLAASDHRMRRARERGDNEALLAEAKARLEHPATFEDAERAPLFAEAGRAALNLGLRDEALQHFVAAMQAGTLAAGALFSALEIARENEDAQSIEKLLRHSAEIRDAIAEAAEQAPEEMKTQWLALLGQAHERAGDEDAALAAHAAVIAGAGTDLPAPSVEFLQRAYHAREDWQALVTLNTRVAQGTRDPDERAEMYYQIGLLWRDDLDDVARGGKAFAACLEANPEHAGAQLARGLMLSRLGDHEQALPLLYHRVDIDSPGTTTDDLLTFAETLRRTESYERAVEVIARILEREPQRATFRAERAELLEKLDRNEDAEQEWKAYADAHGTEAPVEEIAPVRQRLAQSALAREDFHEAMTQLEEARRLIPDSLEIIVQLRQVFEKLGQWREAVELRLREAVAAETLEERVAQYRELARVYRHELGDFAGAALMMERALQAAPDAPVVLQDLLALHEAAGDWPKFMAIAERILEVVPEPQLGGDFFARLARAYQEAAGDETLAREYYKKAAQRDPTNAMAKAKYRELARRAGDWDGYAVAEEQAIEEVENEDDKVARYQDLAEVYLTQLANLNGAAVALAKARQLRPADRDLLRRLADTYALEPSFYDQAAALYGQLLDADPLSVDVIRIRARLAGQMGEADRAYGDYAALLALTPSDDEAREYVQACRGARPPGPQRAVTDADRTKGLIHPDQSGVAEELYAPLARFAELTRPGDLAGRGITEADRLQPTDDRAAWLAQVLAPLGLPQVDLFVWRGGGYACEAELVGTPTLLIGASLADTPNARERAFLIARTAELYRTGHALCDKLSEFEIGGLVAAICLAIEPKSKPPGDTFETVEWAQVIAAPMNDEIRAQLAPQVLAYLSAGATADIGKWRGGCLATAGRVAMLLACDVGEAIDALMRVRGFDDLTEEQRIAVIRESPEDTDLLRFAVSDAYFELRASLGLALRPQG